MTCREFTRKIESFSLSGMNSSGDKELLAHQSGCASCATLLQQRNALSGAMQVLRSSTAGVQASSVVEQNVLRAFRQSAGNGGAAERNPLARVLAFRMSRWFEWGAYAAAAAALAISIGLGGWYWQHQRRATSDTAQQDAAARPGMVGVQQENRAQIPAQVQSKASTQQPTRVAAVSDSQAVGSVPVLAQAQQAQGYTPMMLCDPLSCSGDAQVVRMELPAADGSTEAQMADVIIGDDGLVRAIRIVQQ